ncbi:Secernin-2 [Gryllus bimaculatus]|nr:Secernin-2 [Gryllus bimaculatus]
MAIGNSFINMKPLSCDTFVVLPPLTSHGGVIFGKNSDRPSGEVQELIYEPAKTFEENDKLQCTYIEIDQHPSTHAVILSKPSWMWGAEMGANDQGVVVGNEAVWTQMGSAQDNEERLLGMDLVRLALERAKSAEEAVDVIGSLLEQFGQGGPCSDTVPDFTYHNSFLIADPQEAWVLETAGRLWVAERVADGCRNISNVLSIGSKFDKCSSTLKEEAQKSGLWDGEEEFNFAKVFGEPNSSATLRQQFGNKLLEELSEGNAFSGSSMFSVLRNEESGICRKSDDGFPTTGSQVSVLAPAGSGKPHCHWFTATPNPKKSVFKPFIFTPNARISQHTVSPKYDPDPAKVLPRFQSKVDRAHNLYKLHAAATSKEDSNVIALLQEMELNCVAEVETFLADFKPEQNLAEVDDLLKDIVETEVKFYK